MIKNCLLGLVFIFMSSFIIAGALPGSAQAVASPECEHKIFNIPTWYHFLKVEPPDCEVQISEKIVKDDGSVDTQVKLTNIWLIILAIIDILATLAGILAVVFIIVGGFKFVTSQAVPEKITSAKNTLTNAVIGLIIAIIATQVVTYFGKVLGS
jgi:hypothetical protein